MVLVSNWREVEKEEKKKIPSPGYHFYLFFLHSKAKKQLNSLFHFRYQGGK